MDSRSSRQTAETHSSDKRSSQQIGEKLQDSQIHRLLNSEEATKMPRQKWPIWDLWEHVLATQHLRAPGVNFRVEDMVELLGEEAHNRQQGLSLERTGRICLGNSYKLLPKHTN